MSSFLWTVAQLGTLLFWPILLVGVINRTKSRWVGRKGPPLLQPLYDLARLARKRPVYSTVTTPIFRVAPYIGLATAIFSGLVVPLLGQRALLSFPFDFVLLAYVWGLGRVFLMLGALDTGSAFEGMGASREATFSALLEPVLFLSTGTLAAATGATSLTELLRPTLRDPAMVLVWSGSIAALFVVLQVECARMPVDDPTTHLELTMIHEVMILDHSGPDLAALQLGSAVKMTVCSALLAALLGAPFTPASAPLQAIVQLAIMLGIAVVVGTVESVIARLKLKVVPQYVLAALVAAFIALLASTWTAKAGG